MTEQTRQRIARAAWESDPRRGPYEDASGPELADVMRDAFAAARIVWVLGYTSGRSDVQDEIESGEPLDPRNPFDPEEGDQ